MVPVVEAGYDARVVSFGAAAVIFRPFRTHEGTDVVATLEGEVVRQGVGPHHRQSVAVALAHAFLGLSALRREAVGGSVRPVVGCSVAYGKDGLELEVLYRLHLHVCVGVEVSAAAAVVAVHHHRSVRVAVVDVPVGTCSVVIAAVGSVYGHDGRSRECRAQVVVVYVARAHVAAVLPHKAHVLANGDESVVHLVLGVGAEVIPFIIRDVLSSDNAVLTGISARDDICRRLAAAGERQVVARCQCAVIDGIVYPVGVVYVSVGIMYGVERSPVDGRHAGVEPCLVHDAHVFARVEHVKLAAHGLPAYIPVVRDLACAFLSALCRDENHAVGSLRAVDGGRGGILEHVDAFDVGRVEVGDVTGDAVDEIERLRVAHGAEAADGDAHGRAGLA